MTLRDLLKSMNQLSTTSRMESMNSVEICDMTYVSARLREERKRLGLSLEEAAKSLGIGVTSLSTYERNKVSPPLAVLLPLAQLGADVLYIITGERNVVHLPEDEQQLLIAFRAATPPVRSGIMSILQAGDEKVPTGKSQKTKQTFTGKVGQFIDGDVSVSGKQIFKF